MSNATVARRLQQNSYANQDAFTSSSRSRFDVTIGAGSRYR
jgi:hypothetical protein